jgi:hypothetical protein
MYFRASPLKPSRTHLKSVSLRLGSMRTHWIALSAVFSMTLKFSSSLLCPLSNIAGVADKVLSSLRTVTCSRSLSYSQTLIPSLTITCW